MKHPFTEIINIPRLVSIFEELVAENKLQQVMNEIVLQSRVEFNVDEDENKSNAHKPQPNRKS